MTPNSYKPWEAFPEIWKSEKAFWTYLRGAFRSIWSKYPAKLEWKKRQGYAPPAGYTGKAKRLAKCALCGGESPISYFEVDHIDEAGSCNSTETAQEFLWRLLNTENNWQLVHKECHKIKSLAVKRGIPYEMAIIAKKVIAFKKLTAEEQKAILASVGCSEVELKTVKSRAEAYTQCLKGGKL